MSAREEISEFSYSHIFDSAASAIEVETEEERFSYLIPSQHRDKAVELIETTPYTEDGWISVSEELEQLSEGSLKEDETLVDAKDRLLEPYQRNVHSVSLVRTTDHTRIEARIGSEEFSYTISNERAEKLDGYKQDVVEARKSLHELDETELRDTLQTFETLSENDY
ncbi:MAG: hypothetical protein H8Z69_00150 [Nanohaloarchaea archaeon]|nr:hypothetical protein [Candidatus Nanohaloarchaea archaeon]